MNQGFRKLLAKTFFLMMFISLVSMVTTYAHMVALSGYFSRWRRHIPVLVPHQGIETCSQMGLHKSDGLFLLLQNHFLLKTSFNAISVYLCARSVWKRIVKICSKITGAKLNEALLSLEETSSPESRGNNSTIWWRPFRQIFSGTLRPAIFCTSTTNKSLRKLVSSFCYQATKRWVANLRILGLNKLLCTTVRFSWFQWFLMCALSVVCECGMCC